MIDTILNCLKSIFTSENISISDNFTRKDSPNIKVSGNLGHNEVCSNKDSYNTNQNINFLNVVNNLENEKLKRQNIHNFLFEKNITVSQLSNIDSKNYQVWISYAVKSNNFDKAIKQKLIEKSDIDYFYDLADSFIDKHLSQKILSGSGDFSIIRQSLEQRLILDGKSKIHIQLISYLCEALSDDKVLSSLPFPKEYYTDIKEILTFASRAFSN